MKLLIAEKPNAALEIAKALGIKTESKNGCIEGEEYIITWCFGHLVTLKSPDDYDPKYKKWNFDDLPILPEKYELKVIEGKEAQFKIVKDLLNGKVKGKKVDFEYVINATDAGREGELIFDYVYRLSGSKMPEKRFWISAALTPEVIQKGIKNLIPAEKMKWLKIAARGRDMIDWSIGMNGTRALTTKTGVFGHIISVGRVQTPTLAFIVEREMEIKKFASKAFYTIEANLIDKETSFKSVFEYFNKDIQKNTHQIFDKDFMEDIYNSVKNAHNAQIIDIKSENKKENPPHLFDLTTLQRESNKLFGLSAEDTLKSTQSLYERHKCLSYPRTDFAHLPPEMLDPLLKSLNDLKFKKILDETYFTTAIENAAKIPKSVFDSSKVGDHHAIIPSGYIPNMDAMDVNEKNIYLLVLKRVLAAFNYFHAYDKNTIIISINENKFYSKGRTVTQKGWKEIYQDNEEDKIKSEEQSLPNVSIGNKLQIKNITKKEDKTKPPKRMSEADLLGAMQNPTRGLQDETFIDILKEKGIGTPATRANIIKNLIEKHYILREGRNLQPTEKGISLILNLKPESLKSPEMTALWEQKLNLMEKGEYSPIKFFEDIKILINEIIKEAPEAAKLFKKSIESDKDFGKSYPVVKSESKKSNSSSKYYSKEKRTRKA